MKIHGLFPKINEIAREFQFIYENLEKILKLMQI